MENMMYIYLDSACGCLFIEDNILINGIVCKKPLKYTLILIVLRLLKDTINVYLAAIY